VTAQARLIIDSRTLRFGAGPVTGNIWLLIEKTPFPAEGWNDFVVVVLDALVVATRRSLDGDGSAVRSHFMEGPYAIELAAGQHGTLRVRAIERRSSDHEIAVVEVRAVELVADLLLCGRTLLESCEGASHSDRDVETLRTNLASLALLAARLTD
jgi:hypothetical protein